jgi:uncharacterized protein (DUF1800 family)
VSTQSSEWIAAARLLRRTGFGTTGAAVDSVLKFDDLPTYVDLALDADPRGDAGAEATPLPDVRVGAAKPSDGEQAERTRYYRRIRERQTELTIWWLQRMIAVDQPIVEKLTFIWHDHFATSLDKVIYPALMAAQNEKVRSLCLGDFRSLAFEMLTDAAMIRWLDGETNRAGAPNENLAREFIELFALGHGNGYTEQDVREGARALTGWDTGWDTDDTSSTTLLATRHDAGQKTVLGVTGNLDAANFCDAVLSHSNSPGFIVGTLWRNLASNKVPTKATSKRLIAAYGAGRDLKAATKAVLKDPDFSNPINTVIIGPVEWVIGLHRALHASINDNKKARRTLATLKSLGQLPFRPPSVGGWTGDQTWLSAAAAGLRLRAAGDIVMDGDISVVEEASASARLDAVGYLLGVGTWSSTTTQALKPLSKDPAALVAAAANTPEYLVS